jgi:phosphatidylglycerophosphate synthase
VPVDSANTENATINQRKRQFYEESSLVLGKACLKLGLTPNFLTALSLLCAIASGLLFWNDQLLWGVILMLATAFTDMLDGSTARAGNLGTVFGGILDHVSDRYGEFFILAGITLSGAAHPSWGLFALFGMLIASYTRAAAESIGKMKDCAVGIMGRLEKFILIIAGSIAEDFWPMSHLLRDGWPRWLLKIGHSWLDLALIIVGVTSFITAVQRLIYAHKILGDKREV